MNIIFIICSIILAFVTTIVCGKILVFGNNSELGSFKWMILIAILANWVFLGICIFKYLI